MLNRDEKIKLVASLAATFAVADDHGRNEALYAGYVLNALKLVDDVEKAIPHESLSGAITAAPPAPSTQIAL